MTPIPEEHPVVEESFTPLTEREMLEIKIRHRKQESLEATRRLLQLCLNARKAGSRIPKGAKSLAALDGQGEKLEHFEKGIKFINDDMLEAESVMNDMDAPCWGLCSLCTLDLPRETDIVYFSKPKNITFETSKDQEDECGLDDVIPKYGDQDKDEEEMQKNMETVLHCIGNLRNMTIDMNNEVTRQNDYIARIQKKMDDQRARIDAGNEKVFELEDHAVWEYSYRNVDSDDDDQENLFRHA